MAVIVCSESDLQPGDTRRVLIDGRAVALVMDDSGHLHAVGDTCSHADISLSEGFVEGTRLECWAHGASFDLTTGAALTLPATEPIPVYAVSVVDGDVYVGSSAAEVVR
jgi:3-phenylpropionate/trans-cinnamate dioxygenase ferredoxin subunit